MYQKILVPLDGSELAECVLPHVRNMAETKGVETVVFARVSEPFATWPVRGEVGWLNENEAKTLNARSKAAAEGYLDNLVSRLDFGKTTIQKVVLEGKPADMLAKYASKNSIDLIIAATHGRSGVSRWVWGSVADKLLRTARVPVLMVRAPGSTNRT